MLTCRRVALVLAIVSQLTDLQYETSAIIQ